MKRLSTLTSAILLTGASLFAADPQLLNMAPSDTQMFAGINVEQAKTSQFGQFLLANMPVNQDFEEFINSTGFDPRNDLREVLIVTKSGAGPTLTSGLVLAKGNFNISKILAVADKDQHVSVASYGGARLLTFAGTEKQSLALVDGSTGIIGSLDDVKAALDRRSGQNAIPAAVMTRINQLSTTEDIWSVSTAKFGGLPLPGAGSGNAGSAVLDSIQQASGGVKFGAQVQLDVQAITASAQDASSLGDVVKLLAQMVQMHSTTGGAAGQVTDLLKTLLVTTDDNTVKVSLTLPEDQLETLFRMAQDHKGAANTI